MAHCISRCRPHTYTLLPLFCITAPPVFLLLLLFPSIDPIIERVRFSWLFFFLIIKHICKSVKTLSSANGETHTARFQKLSCQTSHQDFCKFVTSQLNSDHLQPHPQHGYGCKKKKKKLAELMWKHGGWCLLRPERADQWGQTGIFSGREP